MRSPLNILMITHKTTTAAMPRSLTLAREMVKLGHRVTIMLISKNNRLRFDEFDIDGIHVIESPDLLWGRLRTGWDPWDTLRRILFFSNMDEQFDLIHCFETRPATIYPALYYSKKHHIPMITDWNDWWGRHGLIDVNRPNWYPFTFGWIETYFEEAFRRSAAGLTVIASALKIRGADLGVEPERICHIPGGTTSNASVVRNIDDCREHSKIPTDGPVLGFSSADSHLDMEIVMESLVIVAKKYPSIKLIITGQAKKEIFDLVKKNSLQDRVIFSGYLSTEDYPWYLGCADLFLLPMADRPYNHGRWPNKMGDYLSIGRPTVSNPVGDIKTLFENHEIGLLAEWNPEDFAEKIIYILDHPEVSRKFSENAREVARTEYDWGILARRAEDFYYKIVEMEKGGSSNGRK
jgi:glycosyltransferase involved in cell wall biosynthesis